MFPSKCSHQSECGRHKKKPCALFFKTFENMLIQFHNHQSASEDLVLNEYEVEAKYLKIKGLKGCLIIAWSVTFHDMFEETLKACRFCPMINMHLLGHSLHISFAFNP